MERNARRIELEQVTVESPCPKRWHDLEGGDRRRFCDECALHVVNLAALTRAEGQALLDERAGDERVCVSTTRRADGSLVTADRAGRWRGLARMAASVLFGLFPLLAACHPTARKGDLTGIGVGDGPGGDGDAGCIELTGEVALPEPSHLLDVPEAVLGRIAIPAPESFRPVEHGDGADIDR